MLPQPRIAVGILLAAALLALSGCLNLGGRTTYVHEKPETLGRVTALETRVAALEQAYVSGAAIMQSGPPEVLTSDTPLPVPTP